MDRAGAFERQKASTQVSPASVIKDKELEAFRGRVLAECLKAGIDKAKVARINHLLSTEAHKMPASVSTLNDYIPFVLQVIRDDMKAKLGGRYVASFAGQMPSSDGYLFSEIGLFFDCTPHIGELGGVIARYLDDDFKVHQVLLGVRHVDKSLDTDGLGLLLYEIVTEDAKLTYKNVIVTSRDAANLNGSVLDGLRIHLRRAADIGCFSHMFNRGGEFLDAPTLAIFMGFFAQHFGHSAPVPPPSIPSPIVPYLMCSPLPSSGRPLVPVLRTPTTIVGTIG